MKTRIYSTSRLSFPLASAIAALLAAPSAQADTTWDGGGGATTNINTAANWENDVVNLLDGTTAATFGTGGSTATINTNSSFTGITINRAASFTIANGSGSLTVGTGGITVTLPGTTSRSHAISESNLILNGDQTWTVSNNGSGAALLTVSSIISETVGARILTKAGTGTLALSGANTFSGGASVTAGKLIVQSNGNTTDANFVSTALGSAAVDVGASGTLQVNHDLSFAGRSLGFTNAITGSGTLEFSAIAAPATSARRLTTVGSLTGFTGAINVLANGNYTASGANATTNQNLTIASGGYYTIQADNGFGKLDGAGILMRNGATGTTRILTLGNNNATGGVFSGVIRGESNSTTLFNSAGLISVTKVGSGTQTLSGTNIYAGATIVQGGTLALTSTGVINGTTGITINGSGAKFLQASSVPSTPAITLTEGTLDGTGTVGAVSVADLSTNKIANGNLTSSSALTTDTLTLGGDVTFDIRTAGSAGVVVTGALTTTPANGGALVNVTSAPTWVTGNTYDLISYGSLSGALGDFTLGTVTGLGGRQSSSLVLNGNNIALLIGGNSVRWTGAASTAWTTTAVGTPFNWITAPAGTDTEFMTTDDVIFNDLASGSGAVTVDISGADVSPNSVIFNNETREYTIAGSNGMATGSTTKIGAASVTLANPNTSNGGTLIQNGTIALRGDNRLLTTGTVTLGAVATTGKLALGDTTTASNQTLAGIFTTGLGGSVVGGNATTDSVLTLHNATSFGGTLGGGGTNEDKLILNKTGSSNLALSGTNTYSGGTTLTGGILTAANSSALGTGPLTFSGGQRLVVSNGFTISNNITIGTNIGVAGRGLIENSGSGNATLSVGTITINNLAAGGGHFASTSTGTLTVASIINSASIPVTWRSGTGIFSGGGSYSNLNIGEGTLRLGTTNGLSTSATVDVATNDPGNFDLAGFNQQLVGITKLSGFTGRIGNSSTTADSTLTTTGTSAFAGTIQDVLTPGTRKVGLTVNGGALTLSNANTFTGGTLISAGILNLGNSTNTLANTGAVNVSGGTLALGTNSDAVGAVTLTSGSITGSTGILTGASYNLQSGTVSAILGGSGIALTKTTSGTVTLTGANTYTGDTFVNEGVLAVNGNSIANTNKLVIDGGKVNLTNTETVNTLFFGGVQQAAGNYTSADPSTNFTGGGTLTVLTGPAGFSAWITGTFASGATVPVDKRGPNDDPDNDGISNLVEYAIASQDPTVGNPTISTFNGTLLSFSKRLPLATDITYAIQDSTDLGLADAWAEVTNTPPNIYVNDGTTISYTLTPGTPAKNFLRLKVAQTAP